MLSGAGWCWEESPDTLVVYNETKAVANGDQE